MPTNYNTCSIYIPQLFGNFEFIFCDYELFDLNRLDNFLNKAIKTKMKESIQFQDLDDYFRIRFMFKCSYGRKFC